MVSDNHRFSWEVLLQDVLKIGIFQETFAGVQCCIALRSMCVVAGFARFDAAGIVDYCLCYRQKSARRFRDADSREITWYKREDENEGEGEGEGEQDELDRNEQTKR